MGFKFFDPLQIKLRWTIVGLKFQRLTQASLSFLEAHSLKMMQSVGKGSSPGTRRFLNLQWADQFVDFNDLIEPFESKVAHQATDETAFDRLLDVASGEDVRPELLV